MSDFAKTLARIGEIEDAYKIAPDQPNLLAACLRLFPAFRAASAEIERLRAGGCARNQTTTQFCAEAVDAIARVESAIRADEAAKRIEECARVAERLNGWGGDCGKGGHAAHIAAAIRKLMEMDDG